MIELRRVYLIRHGEVEERFHQVFGGRLDMGLSAQGQVQVQRLARALAPLPLQVIFTSPLQRARLTAEPLAQARNLPLIVLDELRELDFGDWTGCSWQEVEQRFGISAYDWLDALEAGKIPNAEPLDQFWARLRAATERIQQQNDTSQVAVVCHGGVIRGLLSLWLQVPLRKTAAFEVDYASVTLLSWTTRGWRLRLLNFTPWNGLPT